MSPRKYLPAWMPDWRLVRAFGAWQILTRVSYAMLVVVPLLAGMWPMVSKVINRHNQALAEATEELGTVVRGLSEQARRVEATTREFAAGFQDSLVVVQHAQGDGAIIAEFASRIREMSQIVEDELAKLKREATLSPWLPQSWALAFFGALSVIIGHAIYQRRAPADTQQASMDEFARQRRKEYREHSSKPALDNALEQICTADTDHSLREDSDSFRRITSSICESALVSSEQFNSSEVRSGSERILHSQEAREQFWRQLKSTHLEFLHDLKVTKDKLSKHEFGRYQITQVCLEVEEFASRLDGRDNPHLWRVFGEIFTSGERSLASNNETRKLRELDVIEKAARSKYELDSKKNPYSAIVSFLFYAFGALVVVYITARQSYAVADTAGWLGS